MAQAKWTWTRGRNALKDVGVGAGTAIAGSDAIELNIDYTKLTKGDALLGIEALKQKIAAGKWPPL